MGLSSIGKYVCMPSVTRHSSCLTTTRGMPVVKCGRFLGKVVYIGSLTSFSLEIWETFSPIGNDILRSSSQV